MRRCLSFIACLVLATVGLIFATAVPASADNCSSDIDCEQTGGYNGAIAVVGGIAAVAAAAVAAATAAAAATGSGKNGDEEPDLAILQLDVNELDVDARNSATVTMTGWHVGKSGQPQRVPMTIWISAPPGCGLLIEPDQGEGQLVAVVRLDESSPTDAEQVALTAHGVWKGKEATEMITVRLGGDLELRLY